MGLSLLRWLKRRVVDAQRASCFLRRERPVAKRLAVAYVYAASAILSGWIGVFSVLLLRACGFATRARPLIQKTRCLHS